MLALPSHAKHGISHTDYQWKSSEAVAGHPDIVHTLWEAERPPYGPYDKIALNRFVYSKIYSVISYQIASAKFSHQKDLKLQRSLHTQ